jgi:hypothetical protein
MKESTNAVILQCIDTRHSPTGFGTLKCHHQGVNHDPSEIGAQCCRNQTWMEAVYLLSIRIPKNLNNSTTTQQHLCIFMLPDVQHIFRCLSVWCYPHSCFIYVCLTISMNCGLCEFTESNVTVCTQFKYKTIKIKSK